VSTTEQYGPLIKQQLNGAVIFNIIADKWKYNQIKLTNVTLPRNAIALALPASAACMK